MTKLFPTFDVQEMYFRSRREGSGLRLDFRRSLVSDPRKNAGSFPEQQLVIEPNGGQVREKPDLKSRM